ncbi:MAG: hypothetical protein M2R45_04702 [Verrucomicrobia subdivision 3 bacterium]|nr:hypothetical protein [Limisphaerales bacterium]MCS1416275.1 hypothetical protein [Limisphaerales bacterium]
MKLPQQAINFYTTLGSLLAPLIFLGCALTSKEEESGKYSTLRLYGSVNPDRTGRFQTVPIYRRSPIMITVKPKPFLDEGYIVEAAVVESNGGFSLRIQYDRRGTGLFENATHRLRNRHIAIHSSFSDSRWLAAPFIEKPISDGVLIFTPDATREEAERIVRGLNAIAEKLREG